MRSTSSSATDVVSLAPQASLSRAGPEGAAQCPHCGVALAGRYCYACGEDSLPPETSWRSWTTQWHRLVRTMRSLWFRPGEMAVRHLHGARVGYIAPVTLFLNAVALFFLFSAATQFQLTSLATQEGNAPWMGPLIEKRATQLGVTPAVVLERAERRFQGVYTFCLAVISGIGYTLVYRLLYRRTLPGWRGAFTLALSYLAFLFTLFLPWLLVIAPLQARFGSIVPVVVTAVGMLVCVAWNAGAARRIASNRWPLAIGKGVVVVACGMVIDTMMSVIARVVSLRLA